MVSVADLIKPSTADAIKLLREAELKVVMLTGDNEKTAQAVANKLGIDEVHADVSPEDKNRIVKEMQDNGKLVAMAGDGINDAPALAQANVGIAMGNRYGCGNGARRDYLAKRGFNGYCQSL